MPTGPAGGRSGPYFGTEPPIRDIDAGGYQTYFLPRGFIFADANSLGTGHSTGCPTIGGVEENLAMKAVIDWFNGKGKRVRRRRQAPSTASWTTGATAMIGTSYVGTLPIGAASLGVDGLKAIVPIAGVSSYYDHRRSYGTVINSFPMVGTDADTLFDNILSRQHPEACALHARAASRASKDRETGDYNAFWDERNYVKDAGRFKAAVLISHGLNDFNVKPRHAARLWAALKAHKVPAKIWWNQGGHGDRANSARGRPCGATRSTDSGATICSAWRTASWTDRRRSSSAKTTRGSSTRTGRCPGAARGAAASAPGGRRRTRIGQLGGAQPAPSGTELIVDDSSIDANVLVAAPQSPHRLVYQTRAADGAGARQRHPVGVAAARRSTSRPRSSARCSSTTSRPARRSSSRAAGPIRRTASRSRGPHRSCQATAYDRAFELQPHDYIFAAGSRIGLVLLSSDRLFTLRPPPGTRLTVSTPECVFALPVVGGEPAWRAAAGQ